MTKNENMFYNLFKTKSIESGIIVYHYGGDLTDDRKICFTEYGCLYTAEELCFKVAKSLEIATLAYPLFALAEKDGDKFNWLHPNQEIESKLESAQYLYFRIRFIPSRDGISTIMKNDINKKALSCLFYQMKDDFLLNRTIFLKHINEDDAFSKSLGLGVIDKVIYGKERNLTMDNLQKVASRQFIPDKYKKGFEGLIGSKKLESNFKPFVGKELEKYKDKGAAFVKFVYIEALMSYCENYGSEEFRFKSDLDKERTDKVTSVTVHPFDTKYPGFKIIDDLDGKGFYQSRIEDLMDVSINDMPGEAIKVIHINRKQGQPFVLKCDDGRKALSFVALLDGYFRLMTDYTHSLCSSVETQFVKELKMLKCHGPVSKSWSKTRLHDRHKSDSRRNFILKLSQEKLGHYILIHVNSKNIEQFSRITNCPDTGKFYVVSEDCDAKAEDSRPEFSGLHELLDHYRQPPPVGFGLNAVVLPSSPFDPIIYLCNNSKSTIETPCFVSEQKKAGVSVISSIELKEKIGAGHYTEVYKSYFSSQEVAVKRLKNQYTCHLKHLCNLAHKASFLGPCNTIVSVLAICLSHPVDMVMEFAPYGDLSSFLRSREKEISIIQIHSASEQIAQALYHLQEVIGEVHGNIQCRNVLVFKFEGSKVLLVKLADPGILPFMGVHHPENNPWYAPECKKSGGSFTFESDRYAYGITIWEVYSFGARPPDLMSTNGSMLPRPKSCPEEIYALMKQCWDQSPDQRIIIKDFIRDIRQYFNKDGGIYNEYAIPSIRKDTKKPDNRNMATMMNGGKMVPHLDSCNSQTPLIGGGQNSSLMHSLSDDSRLSFSTNNTLLDLSSGEFDFNNGFMNRGEISKHQLTFHFSGKPLGQGHYGEVYKGEFKGDDGRVIQVAVKCLKKSLYSRHLKEFEKEFKIMESLKHDNIVQVIGRCVEVYEECPMVLVLEYVEKGCLRDYLRKFKDDLDIRQLLQFGYEIAQGMLYLAELKIVHRDLAARNVLVTQDLHMKIADFGLSRALSPNRNYYKSDGNKELPAPWCAPESLLEQQFNEKSDVWSYGVTFWEILSYGGSPQFCEAKDLVMTLHSGSRLLIPKDCPQMVYNFIIKHCWEYYPEMRSDFQKIINEYYSLIDNNNYSK